MCRSIKTLRNLEPAATAADVRAAARQFVRKVSGFHKPSQANSAVFEAAVEEIAVSAERLLASLAVKATVRPQRAPAPTGTPEAETAS